MRRSTCIISTPRSGTTLLHHYLQDTRGLQFAGEFLSLNEPKYFKAQKVSDTGDFMLDHKITEISEGRYDHATFQKWAAEELRTRLELLHQHNKNWGPVIVKGFINTFRNHSKFLEWVCENYDIVVLSRRNTWLALLSYFICRDTGVWHAYESQEQIEQSKEIVNAARITVDENFFYYQIQHQNFLTTVQQNIKQFNQDAVSLYFEDYEDDPVPRLNEIFGTTMQTPMLNFTKLIDDHESKIVNIDRLRQMYNRYILKV